MVKTHKQPLHKSAKRTAAVRNVAGKRKSKHDATTEKLKNEIIAGMQEKKAMDIVALDLRDIKNAEADFFLVCHADSKTHVEAIAKEVEDYVFKKTGEWPHHREGIQNAEWILLDYFNTVAHIFRHEQRDFYGIERLWADAAIQQIANNY